MTISRRKMMAGASASALAVPLASLPALGDDRIMTLMQRREALYAESRASLAEWSKLYDLHVAPLWDKERYAYPGLMPPGPLAAYDRASANPALVELERQSEAIADRIIQTEVEILETPAESLPGLHAKLRVAWDTNQGNYGAAVAPDPEQGRLDDTNMLVHIMRDVERMAAS